MGDLRRLIVFDLDGTLVDSRRDLADSANELIVELGGAPLTEEAVGGMVGEGAATLVRRALAGAGLRDARSALARFLEIYDARLLNHTRIYDGIDEAVRHARVIGPVAVLTNKPQKPTEAILRGLGLRDLFDDIIGGDGPFPRKPDPASLRQLIIRHGATARSTVMVGDSWVDCETGRAAGTSICLAGYGFGFKSVRLSELCGDEAVVDSPAAIPAAIQRLLDIA